MTSIKFTASGCSAELGNFAPGDIARNIPAALAQHLVQDACCAEYLQPTTGQDGQVPAPKTEVPKASAPQRQKKTTTTHKEA